MSFSNKIYKFKDIDEAGLFLNGAVFGSTDLVQNGGVVGIPNLVGKKLKFLLPTAAEYTFILGAGPDPHLLRLADIKAQLEGAIAGLLVRTFGGRLCLIESTPSLGVQLTVATTPSLDARIYLGFDSGTDSIGKFYYPPGFIVGGKPSWVWVNTDAQNFIVVNTWE